MLQATKNELFRQITALETLGDGDYPEGYEWFDFVASPKHQDLLHSILRPLLEAEGYSTEFIPGPLEHGPDFLAKRRDGDDNEFTVGVQQKHYKAERLPEQTIQDTLAGSRELGIDRLLIVVNTSFTEAAHDAARTAAPGSIELLDIPGLRAWVGRIDVESEIDALQIKEIIKVVNNRFAKLIVESPERLDELEWRDLERLIADMFDGMGFKVELTPGSKDGGKDVILTCTLDGKRRSYIVEIKHWRSRQKVGKDAVKEFLNVLVREKREGGLYLSTYGYANNAFESLTRFERKNMRFGDEEKIVTICKNYLKIQSGVWTPPKDLTHLIFSDTI